MLEGIKGDEMSMGEYYEDMVDKADRDNEDDRLERIAQAEKLDNRTKELISQQAKIIMKASISVNNAEWKSDIKKAWNEYVIYPITIDPEKSRGNTHVTFYQKPEFPEFLKKWQERKRSVGL